MKIKGFSVICLLLCFAMLFSMVSCSSFDSTIDATDGETEDTEEGRTEDQTEKKTEKKTEKRTEKKTEKATEAPVTFKVRFASYNLFHAEKAGYDYGKIANNITSNKIDIVGFQEVDNNTRRCGKVSQIKKIAEKTGYANYKFFKAISHDGGEYGLAILSKYPIESTNLIKLSSGSAEQRILAHAVINVNGEKINFFVTHLSYDGEGGGSSRSTQFKQIAAELSKYDNFVLSGDFNTRDLTEYEVIKGSALVNTKENPQITYPDGRSPLDNLVYSTSCWNFDKINVVTQSYSDHYMIHSLATYTKKK